MLKLLLLMVCLASATAHAQLKTVGPLEGSYAKCLLDDLPGVASDIAAYQIAQQCLKKYPEALQTIESSGLFGFDSPGECVAKKARDTASHIAAGMISGACYHRYNKQ